MNPSKQPKALYTGTCARDGCDKQFTSTVHNQKFCSRECLSAHWAEVSKVEPRKETCPICDEVFTTTHSNKLYCSEDCKTESKNTAGAAERMYLPPKEYVMFKANQRAFELWRGVHGGNRA